MSAAATLKIRRRDDDLRFGRHVFPLKNAESLWVKKGKDRLVTIICANGNYRTHLHFWMRNAEEMCRLVGEVMEDDKIKIHLPHFVTMIPKPHPKASRSMIEFPMVYEEDVALFDSYTVPRFLNPLRWDERNPDEEAEDGNVEEIVEVIQAQMPVPPPLKSWKESVQSERHFEILAQDAEDSGAVGIIERLQVEDGTGEPLRIASTQKRVHAWMAQPEDESDGVQRHAGVLEKRFRHLWKKDPLAAVALLRTIRKIEGLAPYIHLFTTPLPTGT